MAGSLLVRLLLPLLAAAACAWAVDRLAARRGLDPPGFRPSPDGHPLPAIRRALALTVLAAALWIGVFAPMAMAGSQPEVDFSRVEPAQLFLLHFLFAVAVAAWYLLGFAGSASRWTVQLGLRARRPLEELGIGLVAGLAGWMAVLGILVALGAAAWAVGGDELLPDQPPAMVPWLAGLPVWLRLAVSLSAGVVEEGFFRGFLQPRAGIALSTALFVLAHAGYQQPLMLVGITLLSLLFALLVRWRQSIWAAVVAHTLFDAVQLLVVVPTALDYLPQAGVAGGLMPAPLSTALTVW